MLLSTGKCRSQVFSFARRVVKSVEIGEKMSFSPLPGHDLFCCHFRGDWHCHATVGKAFRRGAFYVCPLSNTPRSRVLLTKVFLFFPACTSARSEKALRPPKRGGGPTPGPPGGRYGERIHKGEAPSAFLLFPSLSLSTWPRGGNLEPPFLFLGSSGASLFRLGFLDFPLFSSPPSPHARTHTLGWTRGQAHTCARGHKRLETTTSEKRISLLRATFFLWGIRR